jgi:MbtH protein
MSNPFEDESETYQVLENAEGQHSLWPAWLAAPAGWAVVHGPSLRTDCAAFIEHRWADLRPRSLRECR